MNCYTALLNAYFMMVWMGQCQDFIQETCYLQILVRLLHLRDFSLNL